MSAKDQPPSAPRHGVVVGGGPPSSGPLPPHPSSPSPTVNVRKQLKYILLGALGTWYWQVYPHLVDVLANPHESGWVVILASVALFLMALTVAIFAYLLLLPASGTVPDYSGWSNDPHLKPLIPALTFCMVGGYTLLVLTLSPALAPKPPSASLSQRLHDAAAAAGANLQSASAGIQLLVSDAARSFGLGSSSSSSSAAAQHQDAAAVDTRSLLRALRLPDDVVPGSAGASGGGVGAGAGGYKLASESLARRLGVPASGASRLLESLDRYQLRAQAWKEGNVTALGWTGAALGAGSAFLLVFGLLGLAGHVLVPGRKAKRAQH